MIGKTVGKYRVVERLGRGGMGTVYRAIDETLDRDVAIKVLNADFGDTELLKRFRAEAVTLARLNHPGIATLYELYRDSDDLLMVMEFVRGETLHETSERMGPLAAPQAAHLVMQMLDALAHAHKAGVVHRDLKPANLMLTESGVVKVMDFGISRVLGTEHVTQGGYMMGTPAYMAPEQVLGGEVDGRADLYAVGVVLYRLLSGQLPFSADTAIAMVQKQVNDPPIPIANFQPDLPPWCQRVLQRALAKAPAERFQTADEFRSALLDAVRPQALGELPTMATPTPPGLRFGADSTRMRALETSAAAQPGRPAAATVTTPLAVHSQGSDRPATSPRPGSGTTPTEMSSTTTTVVIGRKHLVGIGAIAAMLLVALAGVSYFALRDSAFPGQLQIGAVPAEETQPGPDGTAALPDQASGPAGRAGTDQPAEAARPAAAGPSVSPSATATAGSIAPGGRPGRGAAEGATPNAPAAAGGGAAAGRPAVETATEDSAAASPVSFTDIRLLVSDGAKSRELNGVLALGEGRVAVLDKPDGTALVSLPYGALTGAAYSRSKQPKWKDEEGNEIERKADLGKLGFLKSERNWVILLSHGEPVIIRLEDDRLRSVLPAIESHTGVRIRR